MSLEQLSFLAQIISAIAVIASLIFVGFQLRQATAAIRASSSQAHSGLYTDLVRSIIDNADFARIWSVGLSDPRALNDGEWAIQLDCKPPGRCEVIGIPQNFVRGSKILLRQNHRSLTFAVTGKAWPVIPGFLVTKRVNGRSSN